MNKKSPITGYYHCRACLHAERHSQLAVGATPTGSVVVWCETCDQRVIEFRPQSNVPAEPTCGHG